MQDKMIQYSVKINDALAELFNEDSENFIGQDELSDGENFTLFLHCLCNVAPSTITEKLSTEVKFDNYLEFNHFANKLCFQFMKKSEE